MPASPTSWAITAILAKANLSTLPIGPPTIELHMTQRANTATLLRRESREEIARIATAYGAGNVRVFGSAGREEEEAHDLDLLVEMATDRNLFDLIALSQELEDTLGIAVDVVSEGALSPYLRERILAEAAPL